MDVIIIKNIFDITVMHFRVLKDLYTYLTSWSPVLLEKLIVPQWVKKLPPLYGNHRLISMSIKRPPLVLIFNQTHMVHSLPSYFCEDSLKSSSLCLGLPICPCHSGLPQKPCMHSVLLLACHIPAYYHPWFHHLSRIWCGVLIMKFLVMHISVVSDYFLLCKHMFIIFLDNRKTLD